MAPALFLLALSPVWTACPGPADPRGAGDIVLVTVDTLRPDHLGLYGYPRPTSPNIDRLFAGGAVYERAYSATASTAPSVVTLLSGRLPQDHRVRFFYQLVPKELPLVTELLPPRYQKAAFVSNIVLTDEAMGIAARFDHYDDFVDEPEATRLGWERSASRTTDAALAWLARHRDPERPLFLWVHYIDPHGPYRAPQPWRGRFTHDREKLAFPASRMQAYMIDSGVDDAWSYVDRYDEEVAYTDAEVGRLLDAYGPRLDAALVVFTADHGETMIEHELWFTHGYHVHEPIVRVPLLLRGPGVEARRVAEPAHAADVAPTLLRFAGAEPPAELPRVDLRSGGGLAADRVLLVEATSSQEQWRAAIRGDAKWMLRVEGPLRRVRSRAHFGLEPGGRPGVAGPWDDAAPPAAELLRLVATDPDPAGIPVHFERGRMLDAPKVAPGVAPQTLEKLKQLGYAE